VEDGQLYCGPDGALMVLGGRREEQQQQGPGFTVMMVWCCHSEQT